MPSCYIATYRPAIRNRYGREAVRLHGIPPFVDSSCRREPDFESRYPSITATCRGHLFAPRLHVGDRVAFLTVKGRYLDDAAAGWRLVAILEVIQRFDDHAEAATWYQTQGLPLPSNCMVPGNPPKPLEQTNREAPAAVKARLARHKDPRRIIRLWNAVYASRVKATPIFIATEAEYLDLRTPASLSDADMRSVFGTIPATLNPPKVDCSKLQELRRVAGV